MVFFFLLLTLFSSPLNGQTSDPEPDNLPLSSDVDGAPSSMVGGCVNVISGDYIEATVDMLIPGPEPLIWERFYSSSNPDATAFYDGWRHNYVSGATFHNHQIPEVNYNGYYLNYTDASGRIAFFCHYKHTHHQRIFEKPSIPKGYTNLRGGVASGKNHLKNLKASVHTHNKDILITNGGNEEYHLKEISTKDVFLIDWEKKGSGNFLLYAYNPKNLLEKISTAGSNKKTIFGSITINHPSSHDLRHNNGVCELIASDGRKVSYKLGAFPGTKDFPDITFRIIKVSGNEIPTVSYDYAERKTGHSYHISKKTLPEGRFQQVNYFKKSDGVKKFCYDRVKELKAPVGHNQNPVSIFNFTYKDGESTVLDAYKHRKVYSYDKYQRLTALQTYDGANQIHHTRTYEWSKEGNLECQQLKNAENQVITARHFTYDKRGNVLSDQTFGSLSGEIKPVAYVNKKPTGESWKIDYKYSDDDRNMLLEESLPNGKITRYTYYPNSDLVASKLILNKDKICLRLFYEYDSNGVLTAAIEDDGNTADKNSLKGTTQRRIIRIKPQTKQPIGLPETIEEYYVDLSNGQECLLKRIENSYSKKGELLKAKHYASDRVLQYVLTWNYDAHSNVTKETNALGEVITRKYNQNNDLIEETSCGGNLVKKHTYDYAGRLIATQEKHSDGTLLKIAFKYDYLNRLVEKTDPYGHLTKYTYDALGNLIATILPPHSDHQNVSTPSIKQEFDLLGNAVLVTDPMGNETLKKFNIRGQPVHILYPDKTYETFSYHLDGSLLKHRMKNGSFLQYTYDLFGKVTKKELISPAGEILTVTSSTYSPFNKISETNAEGRITQYRYDGAGRPVAIIKGDALTEHAYDTWGRIASTKEWISKTEYKIGYFTYDALNRVIEEREEDTAGIVHSLIEYKYDAGDNRIATIKHTDTGLQVSQAKFNSQKQPIFTTDPEGNTTHYIYNEEAYGKNGQRTYEITVVDPLGNQTITLFNELDKPETILKKNAMGDTLAKKELSYDCAGNLVHAKEAAIYQGQGLREIETLWTYNKVHQLTSITEAKGTKEQKITAYKYDSWGQKSQIIKPDGTVISHKYDANGRLGIFSSDDNLIAYAYSYNKNDDVVSVHDKVNNQKNSREYDKNGRLAAETLGSGFRVEYAYDRLGRPVQVKLADGSSIKYAYNCTNLKKITRIKDNREIYFHEYLNYDLAGKLLKSQMAGQAGCMEFGYSLNGVVQQIRCDAYQEALEFNHLGHITKCSSNFSQQEYAYDALQQLSCETGLINHTYEHDSLYNCIAKDNFVQPFNALNQLQKTASSAFTYDRNGNRAYAVSKDTKISYSYDALDRLVEFADQMEKTTYTYDSFNRRLSKTRWDSSNHVIEKINYIYFGQNEVGSFDQNKVIQELRVLGGGLGAEIGATIALELKNEVFVPINDHNGNIVSLLDLQGHRVGTCMYSAFGEEHARDGILSPWRFASKRVDEESGLVNFGRRYYDPSTGTWLTPDPIGFEGGPNLYAYVLNSPLDHIDLYGLEGNWAKNAWEYSSNFVSWSMAENVMKLPGVIVEMIGYELVPIPIIRDVVMMIGRAMQGQTPHFHIHFNHSEYLGYVGTVQSKNRTLTYANGIMNSKQAVINYAKELSEQKHDEMIHVFYNASNGLVLDLLECFALKLGLSVEAPQLLAEMNRMLLKAYPDQTLHSGSHSQGALVMDRSLNYLTPQELNRIAVETFGSPTIIENRHLYSVINFVSVGDPIPFLADPLSVFKLAISYDRRIYFRSSYCPFYDHLVSSPIYNNTLKDL